MKLVHNKVNID